MGQDDSGTVNLSGGIIGGNLFVNHAATLNLFGTDLKATLTDAKVLDGAFSSYTLSGKLTDGTSLDGKTMRVQNGTGARFTLTASQKPHLIH